MNQFLHNDPKQDVSASDGWQDMHQLLDKHLPVIPAPEKRKPFFYYLAAACFVVVLLLSYLQLQQNIQHSSQHPAPSNGHVVEDHAVPAKIDPSVFAAAMPDATHRPGMKYFSDDNTLLYSNEHSPNTFEKNKQDEFITEKFLQNVLVKNIFDNVSVNKNIKGIPYGDGYTQLDQLRNIKKRLLIANEFSPKDSSAKVRKNGRGKGLWEFAAGIGMNAVIGQPMNAQPYPVAAVKYSISARFYLSAGITAWSPVNSSSRGIEKTVYVNDTVNNFRSYNQVTRYTRFHYADIPVMAGVHINKKLSVQAGVQASVLLSQKNRQTLDKYDFQMNQIVAGSYPVALSPVSNTENFETTTRKIDYRLLGGVRYDLNRISFNLSYQHALKSPVYGDHVSSGKNRVVSLQVVYRIKN